MTTRIIRCISQTFHVQSQSASITLMKLPSNSSSAKLHDNLKEILYSVRTSTMGRNFMVVVSFDLIETVMEYAKMFNLANTKNQWLYVIANTNYKHADILRFKKLIKEGDNIAFIYNYTSVNTKCTVRNQLFK